MPSSLQSLPSPAPLRGSEPCWFSAVIPVVTVFPFADEGCSEFTPDSFEILLFWLRYERPPGPASLALLRAFPPLLHPSTGCMCLFRNHSCIHACLWVHDWCCVHSPEVLEGEEMAAFYQHGFIILAVLRKCSKYRKMLHYKPIFMAVKSDTGEKNSGLFPLLIEGAAKKPPVWGGLPAEMTPLLLAAVLVFALPNVFLCFSLRGTSGREWISC